ncbi:hypothetical protein ACERK3_02255 [Phycisphaerales bacterium AB-hyl4]|uniref:Tail assembly chaperone n=1 Tax=Natronomicrosphaera hydrolytica TaxID=3242702 RepID=A0ABV4U2I9_9BACT
MKPIRKTRRGRITLADLNINERLALQIGLMLYDPRRTRWQNIEQVRETWEDVRDEMLADSPTRSDGTPLWAVAVLDEGMSDEDYQAMIVKSWTARQAKGAEA